MPIWVRRVQKGYLLLGTPTSSLFPPLKLSIIRVLHAASGLNVGPDCALPTASTGQTPDVALSPGNILLHAQGVITT